MRKTVCLVSAIILGSLAVYAQDNGRKIPDSYLKNPAKPILLMFTASWCGPCHALKDYTFTDTAVEPLMRQVNFVMADIESPEGKQLWTVFGLDREGIPHLFLMDKEQRVIDTWNGYNPNPALFAEFLKKAVNAADDDPIVEQEDIYIGGYTYAELEKMGDDNRMASYYSGWWWGVEPGFALSNLAGSETYTDYKTGYSLSLFAKHHFTRRSSILGGLSFVSLGGNNTVSSDNIRLNYLSLPIDFEQLICSPTMIRFLGKGDLNLSVGSYGSYLLSEKSPAGIRGFRDWDAGARVRLIFHQGAMALGVGWTRGLVDLIPGAGRAYNNSFGISLTLENFGS